MSEEEKKAIEELDLQNLEDIKELRKAAIYWKEKYKHINQKKQPPRSGLGGVILK